MFLTAFLIFHPANSGFRTVERQVYNMGQGEDVDFSFS